MAEDKMRRSERLHMLGYEPKYSWRNKKAPATDAG